MRRVVTMIRKLKESKLFRHKLRAMAIFTVVSHIIAFAIIIGGFAADLKNAEPKSTFSYNEYVAAFSQQSARRTHIDFGGCRPGLSVWVHTVM